MPKLIDTSNYHRVIETHKNSNIKYKKYICKHCNASFSHLDNFDLHYQENHKTYPGFFNCC